MAKWIILFVILSVIVIVFILWRLDVLSVMGIYWPGVVSGNTPTSTTNILTHR